MRVVFIMGVPRSGTSWLWSLIASHDNAVPFAREGTTESNLFFRHKPEEARRLLKASDYQNRLIVEKTPDHILRYHTIKAVVPEAKFIFITRNDKDTIESIKNYDKIKAYPTPEQYHDVRKNTLKTIIAQTKSPFVVKYEELRANTEIEVKRILKYVDLEIPDNIGAYIEQARRLVPDYNHGGKYNNTVI